MILHVDYIFDNAEGWDICADLADLYTTYPTNGNCQKDSYVFLQNLTATPYQKLCKIIVKCSVMNFIQILQK